MIGGIDQVMEYRVSLAEALLKFGTVVTDMQVSSSATPRNGGNKPLACTVCESETEAGILPIKCLLIFYPVPFPRV